MKLTLSCKNVHMTKYNEIRLQDLCDRGDKVIEKQ